MKSNVPIASRARSWLTLDLPAQCRYFYAIVTCDDAKTGQLLYNECDGATSSIVSPVLTCVACRRSQGKSLSLRVCGWTCVSCRTIPPLTPRRGEQSRCFAFVRRAGFRSPLPLSRAHRFCVVASCSDEASRVPTNYKAPIFYTKVSSLPCLLCCCAIFSIIRADH